MSTPESVRDACEACGGKGWLLVNIDGHEAPPTMAYLQKCDQCDYFLNDFWAALAYNKAGNGALLGVVVRNEATESRPTEE